MNFQDKFPLIVQNQKQSLPWLPLLVAALDILIAAAPVQANCADKIASLELVQPAMERLWQQLQEQTQYSWGKARPYQEIQGNRIVLSAAFDALTGSQKQQVLDLLKLDYNNNWFDLLDPSERQAALQNPGIGSLSPYQVYASDGREVSLPYDGCTRMTLLSERARFSWYSHELERGRYSGATSEMLRNVGYPPWRKVRFPISAQQERIVRQTFWQAVGYRQAERGWWIAWVPEQGHFEINLPLNYERSRWQRFRRVAPSQYRYVLVTNDGTLLETR